MGCLEDERGDGAAGGAAATFVPAQAVLNTIGASAGAGAATAVAALVVAMVAR